jgi:hypothetical protein
MAEQAKRDHQVWDDTLWLINDTHRRYSKFKLSMDRNGIVSCDCVDQEGLGDMLRRLGSEGYMLPISKTAPPPSRALELLGSVECYHDVVIGGFGPWRGHFIDLSGCALSSVVMVSQSTAKVLSIMFCVDKLDILLDNGMGDTRYRRMPSGRPL